jgi:hypothetical protein
MAVFYNVVRAIMCRRGRKYVNRQSLTNFFTPKTCALEMPDIDKGL